MDDQTGKLAFSEEFLPVLAEVVRLAAEQVRYQRLQRERLARRIERRRHCKVRGIEDRMIVAEMDRIIARNEELLANFGMDPHGAGA